MNAWLVRPFPNNQNRINEFHAQSMVAIGWPGIGNLTGKSREDIKKILAQPPYNAKGLELGNAYATIDIFVNQANIGDLVLVPNGDDIYFAEIVSDYKFEASVIIDGYPHQRDVRWISSTSRSALSKELRTSLKVHRTTANLSRHSEEIEALATGRTVPAATASPIDVVYPLRPDFSVGFKIPADISKLEAERLSAFFSTLHFVE